MSKKTDNGTKNLPIIILLVSIVLLLGIIIGLLMSTKKTIEPKTEAQQAETYVAEPQAEKTQNKSDSQPSKIKTGTIEGSLGYPGEGIPDDIKICAENIISKETHCTTAQLKDNRFTYGIGYHLEVPAASYYVFAASSSFGEPGYKAYYSYFVTCGMSDKCKSHDPIAVIVSEGEVSGNTDPIDWYSY